MSNKSKPNSLNRDTSELDANEVSIQAAAIADHLQRSGVQWLPKPQAAAVESLQESFAAPAKPASAAEHQSETTSDVPQSTQAPRPTQPRVPTPSQQKLLLPVASAEQSYPGNTMPAEQRQSALDVIDQEVKACLRCDLLVSCRTKTVFGEGSSTPRFVFFGEGPGAEEDRSGRPFVGRAGDLLTKMIEACTLRREDVYILNTIKCRPPGNRNPEPDELENCRDYYQRQLAILRPEYIVCLGAISSHELLQNKTPVGRMRGRFHAYYDSKVLVTYHPAYLLRNPAAKKAAWEDLQLMMRDAGLKLG